MTEQQPCCLETPSKLIDNDIRAQWLPDGRLWYRSLTENRSEFKLFDPNNKQQIVVPPTPKKNYSKKVG